MLLRVLWMAAVAVGVSFGSWAQEPKMTLDQMKADCPKSESVPGLRSCVEQLLDLHAQTEKSQEIYMRLVADCAALDTVLAMTSCLKVLTGSLSDPKASPSSPAPTVPQDLPVPAARPTSLWEVSESASRMDGSPSVVMSLDSEDVISNAYGGRTRPTLILRCRERTTNLYVVADWFLGSRDVEVMFRIDDAKPQQARWNPSSNSKAVGLWSGAQAIPFVKALFGKKTLLVRVTPYNDVPREMSFEIGDLAEKIEPLRKACGW